jgi:hypothetical protein
MNILPYRDLMAVLRQTGLKKAQVKALLPAWWDEATAATPAGAWEFALMVSRRLGLDALKLARGEISPMGHVSEPRFKHTARVSAEDLQASTRIAGALAKAVLSAMPDKAPVRARSAQEARAYVLAQGAARIDFDGLLQFAWACGIPVIPLPNLPSGVKKMDALAIKVGSRPAIVIARKSDSKAWLSFLLAHELGHVLLEHVPDNGAIVEGSLKDTADFGADSQLDQHEREANDFAHDLLGGAEASAYVASWGARATMMDLVDRAMVGSAKLKTAPGHLILRYAFSAGRWADAQLALRFLADDMDAQVTLVDHLATHIDTSALAEDMQEFVERVTGVTAKAA